MLSRFVYVCITFILKLVLLYICILHVFIDRRVHVLSFFKQSGTRGIIPFFLYLHIVNMGILLHLRYEILRKILSLPCSISRCKRVIMHSLMYFENTIFAIQRRKKFIPLKLSVGNFEREKKFIYISNSRIHQTITEFQKFMFKHYLVTLLNLCSSFTHE